MNTQRYTSTEEQGDRAVAYKEEMEKKQPVRATTKKYTRDELALMVHNLTTELSTVRVQLVNSEENRKYAWQRTHNLVDRQEQMERQIWHLKDDNYAASKAQVSLTEKLHDAKVDLQTEKTIRYVMTVVVVALSVLMLCQ